MRDEAVIHEHRAFVHGRGQAEFAAQFVELLGDRAVGRLIGLEAAAFEAQAVVTMPTLEPIIH